MIKKKRFKRKDIPGITFPAFQVEFVYHSITNKIPNIADVLPTLDPRKPIYHFYWAGNFFAKRAIGKHEKIVEGATFNELGMVTMGGQCLWLPYLFSPENPIRDEQDLVDYLNEKHAAWLQKQSFGKYQRDVAYTMAKARDNKPYMHTWIHVVLEACGAVFDMKVSHVKTVPIQKLYCIVMETPDYWIRQPGTEKYIVTHFIGQ